MRYRIGAVSRMTGLPIDVIRAWERRYGVVAPTRDEKGLRLYSDADIEHLSRIRRASESGHSISQLAALAPDELEKLAEASQAASGTNIARQAVSRIIAALLRGELYETELAMASAVMMLEPRTLALDVLAPALREVGALWEAGTLEIWQEHLLSAVVRNLTGSMMRTLPRSDGRSVLFATPPFEMHEFGIAIAAVLAAVRGLGTHMLGVNVPVQQVLHAATRMCPSLVVIGMTRSAARGEAEEYVTALERGLSGQSEIWLGGPLGAQIANDLSVPGIEAVASLEAFDRRLAGYVSGHERNPGGTTVR